MRYEMVRRGKRLPPEMPISARIARATRAISEAMGVLAEEMEALRELQQEADKARALKPVASVDHAIELLGGNAAVAEICGYKSQVVSDWKRNGYFSKNVYSVLQPRLNELGYEAPLRLFRMKEPS